MSAHVAYLSEDAARFRVRYCNDLRDALEFLEERARQELSAGAYDSRMYRAMIAAQVEVDKALGQYREHVSRDAAPWFDPNQPEGANVRA